MIYWVDWVPPWVLLYTTFESHFGSYLNWFRDPPAPGGPVGDRGRFLRCRRRHRCCVRRIVLLCSGAVARRPVERSRNLFARLSRAPEIRGFANLNFPPSSHYPHYRVTILV